MTVTHESEAALLELKWPHLRNPREIGAMVEAQVRRWVSEEMGRGVGPHEGAPVVTVACESDTEGFALGRGVAERLGFSYWDRGIVTEIARLLRRGEGAAAVLDVWTRAAIANSRGASVAKTGRTSVEYSDEVYRIMGSIAGRGSAVIVDREAQCLVDPGRTLQVRLVAPFRVRGRKLKAQSGTVFDAVKRSIVTGESEHAASLPRAVEWDVEDPVHYDLVVNTDTYRGERAEAVVLMAYLAKFSEWPVTARELGKRESGLAGPVPNRAGLRES